MDTQPTKEDLLERRLAIENNLHRGPPKPDGSERQLKFILETTSTGTNERQTCSSLRKSENEAGLALA